MLNPNGMGTSVRWNYSRPDQPDYSTELVGTVVAIQEVQAMNFGNDGKVTTPKFWQDGNPVWNIRMAFAKEDGSLATWTFQPAGKAQREGKKPSVHMALFALTNNTDMRNLIGQTLRITTEEPAPGYRWGIGNPRPWKVELLQNVGPFELAQELDPQYTVGQVLADTAASGGHYNTPQQQQQQQPMPNPQYQQPTMQQPQMYQQPMMQPQMQPMMQPQMQQPAMRPQMPQPAMQPMVQQSAPMGMDPNVVAGMQAMGVQPQPVMQQPQAPALYDDIPF